MEELIQTISARVGVADTTVRKAVKVLLKFAQKQMKEADFNKLINQLPGAAELLAQPSEPSAPASSSLFGGLSSLLGGQAGDAAAAFSDLKAAGLQGPQIAAFLQAFIEKGREVAGPETVDNILKEIPILQTFLKSSK